MSTRQHRDVFIYSALKPDQVALYDDQGYLPLGPVLTDKGLEALRREAMAAWEAEKGPFDPTRNWLQNSLLVNVHHRSDTARRFYFSGPLVEVAEQLIGPNIKGATSQLTFKMRGNTMPFGWHQDNGYGELQPYNALTTLTALDDVDLENGCLWLIPGSHKQGQIAAPPRTAEERRAAKEVVVAADESKAVPMPMKAGESIILHCWMLHKSEGNRSKTRDRRILFLRYADADAVEAYNNGNPRLGRLVRGRTRFAEVEQFESHLPLR